MTARSQCRPPSRKAPRPRMGRRNYLVVETHVELTQAAHRSPGLIGARTRPGSDPNRARTTAARGIAPMRRRTIRLGRLILGLMYGTMTIYSTKEIRTPRIENKPSLFAQS